MKFPKIQACTNSCQKTGSSCCKKGFIFIPDNEYQAILNFLEKNQNNYDISEFISRCEKKDGYYLYDQKNKCQFLDTQNLCRLHNEQIKPTECFWWPLHVYYKDNQFSIKVANCCDGCQSITSYDVNQVKKQAQDIGLELIKKFRQEHNYGENYIKLDSI